jgi:hypothetical protein
LYAVALTGVCIALWLAIETGFIKINLAVTLGEREGDDTYYSFDPMSRITRDGYVFMDTTLSFRAPQRNLVDRTRPYRSVITLRAFDCRNKSMGVVRVKAFYSEEFARGEIVLGEEDESRPLDEVEFKPTVPGSRREQLVRIACSDISRTRLWWAAIKLQLVGGKLDIPGM